MQTDLVVVEIHHSTLFKLGTRISPSFHSLSKNRGPDQNEDSNLNIFTLFYLQAYIIREKSMKWNDARMSQIKCMNLLNNRFGRKLEISNNDKTQSELPQT